jgi:hypothetical protein
MAKKQQPRIGKGAVALAPAASPILRANVNRHTEMSPSYTTLYANDIQFQTTPWDVRLIFGVISNLPTPESPTATVMQVGELRVSPQLAKKMIMIMHAQLRGYEAQYGEIPVPTD